MDSPLPSSDCYSLGKLLYYFVGLRTLPRERHREPRYNLLGPTADPQMHFVYDLLDHTLVEDPDARFRDAGEFLIALDGVLEKMEKDAHVLDLNVVQKCMYCIEGKYQLQMAHQPAPYGRERTVGRSAYDFGVITTWITNRGWLLCATRAGTCSCSGGTYRDHRTDGRTSNKYSCGCHQSVG